MVKMLCPDRLVRRKIEFLTRAVGPHQRFRIDTDNRTARAIIGGITIGSGRIVLKDIVTTMTIRILLFMLTMALPAAVVHEGPPREQFRGVVLHCFSGVTHQFAPS